MAGAVMAGLVLELPFPGFVLLSFVIGPDEDRLGHVREVHDGGDQRDDLVFPVALAIRDLVLDHPHVSYFQRSRSVYQD